MLRRLLHFGERWEGRLDPANEDKLIPADTKVDILYQGPQREEFRVPTVRTEGNSLFFRTAFPLPVAGGGSRKASTAFSTARLARCW